ncbi:hypothetical protein [Nonomuraea sp. NPDC046570]|uniref:hypothetical protein n=1 Tax=Nonomuraea sp. NPDC046570 TaxID=3155255 RepID=UPI0033E06600
MSDRHQRLTAVLDAHLTPYLRFTPYAAREDLYGRIAGSLAVLLAASPRTDRQQRLTAVLVAHLTPYLRFTPYADREDLYDQIAASLAGPLAANPRTVLHPYFHGPSGCRQAIGAAVCGLARHDDVHAWPFGEPADVPQRAWYTLWWRILNPAAPAAVFDEINPVRSESWEREDWATTGEKVVTLWQKIDQSGWWVFYGGWDADQVRAAWQADRDRLAAAGGFTPLPFGPRGVPDDDLVTPPREHTDDDDECWC